MPPARFPLDPARYDAELRAALKQRQDLHARTSNWPTAASSRSSTSRCRTAAGWRRMRTSPSASGRSANSKRTRTFLDTIIENVPSPIIVKDASEPALSADQPRRREISRHRPRQRCSARPRSRSCPKAPPKAIVADDRKADRDRREHAIPRRTRDRHAGQRHAHRHRDAAAGQGRGRQAAISDHRHHDVTERKRSEQRIAHHGASRSAHRSAEPRGVQRMHRRHHRAGGRRRAKASPCCASISTASRRSTTCSAIASATRCCAKRRAGMETGLPGRLPGARRRRRIRRHHADRAAAGGRRGARRTAARGVRVRHRRSTAIRCASA